MTALLSLLAALLHMALMVAAAPLLLGWLRRLKARLAGRSGPPLLQPYRDLRRLARKQPVLADSATWLFRAAPVAVLAATLAAASLVPSFAAGMATARLADLIVLAGLLGVARFTLALAAMDTGTAFGGMGAARMVFLPVFAEPALLLVVLSLGLLAGSTNLDIVTATMREAGLGLRVSLGLALIALVMVALVENGRLPADNPGTHLELTMLHEAALLEYSGRHLALLELAAAVQLLTWLSLVVALFAPWGIGAGPLGWLPGLAAWAAKMAVLATALGGLEVSLARMRLFRLPDLLGIAALLGLLAALLLFVSQGFV